MEPSEFVVSWAEMQVTGDPARGWHLKGRDGVWGGRLVGLSISPVESALTPGGI